MLVLFELDDTLLDHKASSLRRRFLALDEQLEAGGYLVAYSWQLHHKPCSNNIPLVILDIFSPDASPVRFDDLFGDAEA